jgi:phage-related baseplate assembly protein
MADPVLAEKDPAVVLGEALAIYEQETGVKLAESDPRRLHLQSLLLLLAQIRQLIDFAGKQSLLRFVSALWIDALAELRNVTKLAAEPSTTTQRFVFATEAAHTIPAGVRVTDGTNIWAVTEDTTETGIDVEAPVECITPGASSNGVAIGQIDTLVDPDLVPGVVSVTNTVETAGGRDEEALEPFRTRLRNITESESTCGPRAAYEQHALDASPTVADAVALGPEDAGDVASYPPGDGEVFIFVLEGERNAAGELIDVVPEPSEGVLASVETATTDEEVRVLTDHVSVMAPAWVDFDAIATYYIGRSKVKQAAQIQADVANAFEAYCVWQQSKIGRDINPDEMRARIVNAGAKRIDVTEPSFQALMRDQSARISYRALVFGGIEDD